MSIGKIGGYEFMRAARPATGDSVSEQKRLAHIKAAYDNQMRMTQHLFGEADQGGHGEDNASSFDVSMINDNMMMEALSVISRIMREEAAVRTPSAPAAGAAPARQAGLPGNGRRVPGELSARFESGDAGVGAIGWDRVGGTSYGKYQIASKTGTMDEFLSYLDGHRPDWADRLRAAGPADTGEKGGAMPVEWKAIAAEDPVGFEKAQHDFIASNTYDPAREMILRRTGLDFDNAPPVLREVLWSTSVQHGPTGAANIFNKVIDRFVGHGRDEDFNAMLIKGVYETRKDQFGASTARVRRSVANRMDEEKSLALNMLEKMSVNRMV
ncbi:MAG: hypothetical protein AB7E51_03485 [Pseudodesulfovibrio sp.]|uniref:VgrG-related protein n=1 Tax=Pseudodesulfovibrio sp. TaxID=2035812 RepID=UPI003D140EA1